jgi:serine/threonine-protein kinase
MSDPPDDTLLDELAGAVLDGDRVDWAHAGAQSDAAGHRLIEHLKVLEAVGSVHRSAAAETPSDAAAETTPGGTWGHLRLLERLGQGATGAVYRAWDPRLDREVALKLLPADSPAAGTSTSTIIEEGRLLARVRHASVVTVYGAEQIGDRVGIWMEFVHGQTLEQQRRAGSTFSTSDVVRIGHDLCGAVQAVHDAGVLHRDIKAQNVMRAGDGRVVLMDFGAGRETGGGASDLVGTPLYLAPEIFAGKGATTQSDVYSLGVLLYYLLTGSYPVEGDTVGDLRRSHQEGEKVSLRATRPELPSRLTRAIERALDPEPARRFPTAAALAADLASLTRSRWRTWLGGAAAVLALAAAVAWFAWPERDPVIAVLPFESAGADPAGEALADGLTYELIASLAAVQGLSVRAPASSFAFKTGPRDIADAGRQLDADFVLDASIVATAGRLRVNARLIRLDDHAAVWSETFDRQDADAVTVQDDLARAIVNSLRLRFGGGQRKYETAPDLYYQYLRARGLQARRQPRSAARAIDLFEQIVARDPTFAPAAAGLALSIGDLWRLSRDRDRQALDPRLQAAALEAVRLDPLLAEAQSAMGTLHARDRRWAEAEAAHRRALALNPSLTYLHTTFVLDVLLPLGRLDDALAVLDQAVHADPLSLDVRRYLAMIQVEAGLYADAIRNSRWVLERDPKFPFADHSLGRALILSGRPEEARPIFAALGGGGGGLTYLGYLLAVTGDHATARSMAEKLDDAPESQMMVYAGLGDIDRAFASLDRAVTTNPWRAATWMRRPEMALLRKDPRYAAALKRLGMPD